LSSDRRVTYGPAGDCGFFMEIDHTNRTKTMEIRHAIEKYSSFYLQGKKITELAIQ